MGLISRTAIEAHTIALQIASLAFMVPLGLGQAATVRVGHAYGARDPRRDFARGLVGLRPDGDLRRPFGGGDDRRAAPPHRAVHGRRGARQRRPGRTRDRAARIAALFQIFDAARRRSPTCCAACTIRASPSSLRLSAIGRSARRSAWRLGFATPLGAVGVWIGLALGLAVVAILLMSRWLGKERRGFPV